MGILSPGYKKGVGNHPDARFEKPPATFAGGIEA
jgi:hypothetical protein